MYNMHAKVLYIRLLFWGFNYYRKNSHLNNLSIYFIFAEKQFTLNAMIDLKPVTTLFIIIMNNTQSTNNHG